MRNAKRSVTVIPLGIVVLILGLLIFPMPVARGEESVNAVEGEASGVRASVTVLGGSKSMGPWPHASIPSSGGVDSDSGSNAQMSIGLLEVIDIDLLDTDTWSSSMSTPNGAVDAESKLTGVELVNGAISASSLTSSCHADTEGSTGKVTLVGARALGAFLSVSPSPNTSISVAGVGTLTLNKQTTDSTGTLKVTAMSLQLNSIGSGSIELGITTCGTETETVSTTTTTASPTTTSTSTSTTPASSTTTTLANTTTTSKSGTTTLPDGTTTTLAPGDTTTSTPGADADDPDQPSVLAESGDEEAWCSEVVGDNGERIALADSPWRGNNLSRQGSASSSGGPIAAWMVAPLIASGGLVGFGAASADWAGLSARLRRRGH